MFGDFLDFDAVRAALNGVQRAYFCYPISPGIVQATAQFAQAAQEAGVAVIVNMSQKSARSDAKSEAARQHWLSEQVFDWSGVPTVHLGPTFFAEWLRNGNGFFARIRDRALAAHTIDLPRLRELRQYRNEHAFLSDETLVGDLSRPGLFSAVFRTETRSQSSK